MALKDDIITAINTATWSTIAKPTMSVRDEKEADLKLGTGWVQSGKEVLDPQALGSQFGPRETTFEIYIACETAANNVLYQANLEAIITAKVVTSGWWEITEFMHDDVLRRHDFHATGKQVVIS